MEGGARGRGGGGGGGVGVGEGEGEGEVEEGEGWKSGAGAELDGGAVGLENLLVSSPRGLGGWVRAGISVFSV